MIGEIPNYHLVISPDFLFCAIARFVSFFINNL